MASNGEGQNRNDQPPMPTLSWDGDRMFNIYIYDYCHKRGFHKTANALMGEADIPQDSQPPINAKQGLLFEWWSVFWVLFQAKNSGQGSEDALVYAQHQAHRQTARVQTHQQPQLTRLPNGVSRPGTQPNGPMTNGVGHNGALSAPGPMPNGTANGPFHTGSQVNGMSSATAPGQTPQGMPQLHPGQRPVGPQHRGPNGIAPFQSPTMAPSPQNPGVAPPPPSVGSVGQMGISQPLTQMNARNMLPPSGPQNSLGPQQQTPQAAYQQLGHSPSNPSSPAQNGLMPTQSPSMAARQPPGMQADAFSQTLNELSRLPPDTFQRIRMEVGLSDKDIQSMTNEERQRLVNHVRQRTYKSRPPGAPGPSNATAGPSGVNAMPPPQARQMPPLAQQGAPPQPQQSQSQTQGQQPQRGNKRNSTSPGQEQEQLPGNESSPPDRKRPRRSPANGEQAPPQAPPMAGLMPFSGHPPQAGAPGGTSQVGNGMMRTMGGGFPGQPQGMPGMAGNPGMNISMASSLGGPQLGMNPPMMSHAGPNGMVANPQVQVQQYRQSMHNLHKNNIPHSTFQQGVAGSPAASDGQGHFSMDGNAQRQPGPPFPGGPGPANANRLVQNKMMPPPSPSTNPVKKEQGNSEPSGPNGRIDGSPQNAAAGGAQSAQAAPPQAPPAPPTPGTTNATMAPPPPSSGLLNPQSLNAPQNPGMMSSHPSAGDMFAPDFAINVDDFAGSMFGTDGPDLNFERDFGEWFNAENGGLNIEAP